MSKHSPGPWTVDDDGDTRIGILSAEKMFVAEAVGSQRYGRAEEQANAKLIAAAPELLEALKLAEQWLGGWASAEPELAVVRAAIAKATT